MDNRNMVALVMLNLSATFDTIDHTVLINRLRNKFGICGDALVWITSYLSNRFQSVVIHNTSSVNTLVEYCVPQGSVLGPLLFSLYVTPLADIAARYGLRYYCNADDTQLYVSFNPKTSTDVIIRNLEACISSVKCWKQTKMLKLNDEKNGVYCVRLPSF